MDKSLQDSQCYAWIFLTLGKNPSDLAEIIAVADAINHAIPTLKELQQSLGYLIQAGLVVKSGKAYSLTEAGNQLRSKATSHSQSIVRVWHATSGLLSRLGVSTGQLDNITQDDLTDAYNRYSQKINRHWHGGKSPKP